MLCFEAKYYLAYNRREDITVISTRILNYRYSWMLSQGLFLSYWLTIKQNLKYISDIKYDKVDLRCHFQDPPVDSHQNHLYRHAWLILETRILSDHPQQNPFLANARKFLFTMLIYSALSYSVFLCNVKLETCILWWKISLQGEFIQCYITCIYLFNMLIYTLLIYFSSIRNLNHIHYSFNVKLFR